MLFWLRRLFGRGNYKRLKEKYMDDEMLACKERVEFANGGKKAIAVGTRKAIKKYMRQSTGEVNTIKRIMYSSYLKCKHLLISISKFRQLHLMDEVLYKNKKCFINNAIKSDSQGNRLYDIVEMEWGQHKTRPSYCVDAKEFKKIYSWNTIRNSLFSHYRWWMMYWHGISLRKMLEA